MSAESVRTITFCKGTRNAYLVPKKNFTNHARLLVEQTRILPASEYETSELKNAISQHN